MATITLIALILLSLVGYSTGAVGKAGKFVDLKPRIIDLILLIFIWTGAVYFRIVFDINKWLVILIWIIISSIIGILAVWPRKLFKNKEQRKKEMEKRSAEKHKILWQKWKEFSGRMGSFQSRIMLSLFYFIIVAPFALAVKIFSDPLHIKPKLSKSHWHPRKEIKMDIEEFRRQF